MVNGDGLNHKPSLMFTSDPRMTKQQQNTRRGGQLRAEFEEDLKRYNLSEDRISYVKSGKNYFAESPDVYEHFLTHYQVPQDTRIFHDNGRAFKRGKTSNFDNLGYKYHVAYALAVHQLFSPNNNRLHGCKSTWRQEHYKLKSGVSSSLRLMNLIDLDTAENSPSYFDKNLFKVKKSHLNKVIGV